MRPPAKYCPTCTKANAWKGPNRGPETGGRPWRRIRDQVLERDGHGCAERGSTGQPNVDHIVPKSRGGTHALSNLRGLCRQFHNRDTGRGRPSEIRLSDLT